MLRTRIPAVLLCLATLCCLNACNGGLAPADAEAGPAGGTPTGTAPLAQRVVPVSGQVEGASAEQLKPGLQADLTEAGGGLTLELDRDALLSRLGPLGSREEIGAVGAGHSIELERPADSGEAVYYEARRADGGGNKVSMGAAKLEPGLLPCPVVFVRQNPTGTMGPMMLFRNLQPIWNLQDQAIMRLDPDGTLTQLLAISDRPIQDLEVNFDGTKIAFSMRELGSNDMELFEVNSDGTNLTQLTFNKYNDGEPTYLPDGRLMFTSERFGIGDFYDGNSVVPQLFVLDRFTGEERLVHLAMNGCFSPIVANNGQVYFVSWDTRLNVRGPRFNRFTIWVMDPDGTKAFPVFGSHICRDNVDCFIDVSQCADNDLLCIHTNFDIPGVGRAHHEQYGSGTVMRVDPLGNPDFPTYRYLTPREIVDGAAENTLGRYKFPVELPGGDILLSYAPGPVWDDGNNPPPDFGLYVLRGDGSLEKACDAPGIWEIGALPLIQREVPPVLGDRTLGPDTPDWGEFACQNIFDRGGDMRQGQPRPEDGPWKLRIIQALKTRGIPTGVPGEFDFNDGTFGPLHDGPVIGEYPVAEDGSFRIRVPANLLLTWELVDGKGRVAVRERMYNMVRPGETATCAGCHPRIDVKHDLDLSRKAFQPGGEGFHDLRGLFQDFESTFIDNTPVIDPL
ncbi:PD40 domain-containing protein [bacterium]|nr:PD40 domain-containing protein [bacterium]